MIYGTGYSSEDCKGLRDYGNKYKNYTGIIGKKTAYNKRVKFNSKTEMNGEELSTMV